MSWLQRAQENPRLAADHRRLRLRTAALLIHGILEVGSAIARIAGNTEVDSHKIASGWPTIRTEGYSA